MSTAIDNRLDRRFTALKAAGRTGLVPFITAGDPAPELTVPVMHALVAAGADVIELGMPFSDPMADGPVIQHASERALRHGVSVAQVLEWVRAFRRDDAETPVVLMGYLNPVEIMGVERFAASAADAGVDGVLLVDCPIEEDATAAPLREAGLRRILLTAPTTAEARLQRACELAEGFLYYVSFAGITGAARLSVDAIAERVADIRKRSRAPVAVGFGVRDADSARAIAAFADAVVIGSALVESLAGSEDAGQVEQRVRTFLEPIRTALDR
ncbi:MULTISPECIES: tryptophan synthase subunit alpha [Oleiagrimonas]|uniref:tryptophan synthase subunit alpha n=1 Tax=Oleiagrimonas TaxID=1649642 RepID=UPI001F0C5803|nr:tryptophan synthase subunit alpha [Oleiagrimonas sp. MCCC 1A03011]